MTVGDPSEGRFDACEPKPSHIDRFNRHMLRLESQQAPVVWLAGRRRLPPLKEWPFASLAVLVMLLSLFTLSMHLGGWTWSSWTYAFSLGVSLPLVAVEVKRKAVITGGALLLLVATVIVSAGLPQYFGYSASHLSWYDLSAHYLGALFATVFLWSVMCWAKDPSGAPMEVGRRNLVLVASAVLVASVMFEFAEFVTDLLFGWGNFHPGIDTAGDLIFDVAGVVTASILISRHWTNMLRRPFWHEGRAGA